MIQVYKSNNVIIKSWVTDIESGAIDQARNVASLPFAFRWIALMPDCHIGYGMPIGGILATDGFVIPNAVGVDIGCFDKDTEFLSPSGWIKISEWSGEKVMQFHPENNKADFVKPLNYIKEKCDKFIHIKTKYGIDQMLSKEHRCLVYKYDRGYNFSEREVFKSENIMDKHNKLKNGFRHRFRTSFGVNIKSKLNVSDNLLRIIIMFSADGSFSKKRCILQFKKERKIKRAKQLLKKAGIEFKKSVYKNGVTRISFVVNIEKGLEKLWKANQKQLNIISDEVLYWDGNNKNCFYTYKKKEADFIHYCFSATGKRAVMRVDRKNEYRVFKHNNYLVGINGSPKTKIRYVKSKDGYKYCFTVPSSYLIMRRGGNIFITGNCGMCSVKTNIKSDNFTTDELKQIMGEIRKTIPVGFKKHKISQKIEDMPKIELLTAKTPICVKEYNNALISLGTLGGGNHFIEIQKGDDGFVYIMIHSGSRNLGLKVATHYNDLAKELNKKWASSVPPSHDLAFLPLESKEAKNYLDEMNYCLEFAYANRLHMMEKVKKIFNEIHKCKFGDMINIHHNFASMENHFGKNVMVHRKGATKADEGLKGIIPGSQGTYSYIVEGLGNVESFRSCSHGAGRKMGRKDACRRLNLEEEKKRLDEKGVVHSVRNVSDLDEAPGAYKDINIIMDNQKDLVKIITKLEPIGVIKG